MKQVTLPSPLSLSSGLRNRRMHMLVAGSLLIASLPAKAQWSGERSYFFPGNSMKHIAITPVAGTGEYMTAGTIFSYKASRFSNPTSALHWMYLDQNANVIFSKVINVDFFDERAVGIHVYGDSAVIVATYRDETSYAGPAPPANKAGVEIISLSKTTGNLGSRKLINSTDPNYVNLYPTASLQEGDQLFVCGYATTGINNSVIPTVPMSKASFILKYDVPNHTLVNMRLIQSASNPVTLDFDMATAMKRVSRGIWVGGSTNNGSMMNRVIDPNTLMDNVSTARAFGNLSPSTYENSYDVVETDNGDLFVFGNTYHYDTTAPGTTLKPMYTHITAVQPSLIPYPGNSRWQFAMFDSPWGVNVLQDRDDSHIVVINGLATNRLCNQAPLTSTSNINPFLAGMKLEVNPGSGDIQVTPQFWNTLLSYNGTGDATLAASYYKLGGFMSSIMLPPASAVRDYTTSSDIVLTCPLWDNGSRLNFKLIRAKNNGEVPGCGWVPACSDIKGAAWPTRLGASGTNFGTTWTVTNLNNTIADYLPDHIDDCSGHYKNAPDQRTGIADAVPAAEVCKVYPNPADKHLVIELPAAATADIRIFDVQGRAFAKQQVTGKRSLKLDVSAYPSGLYFYTIQYDGHRQSGKVMIRR